MSKIKLLLDVIEDMRKLADSLQAIADNIEGNTPDLSPDNTPSEVMTACERPRLTPLKNMATSLHAIK